MTDAQQLIDFARHNFNALADDVEKHFNHAADKLRESFSKTIPLTPPVRRAPPPTTFQVLARWLSRHGRAITIGTVLLLGGGALGSWLLLDNPGSLLGVKKRRRATKTANGARTDVVIVAGTVADPLTSAVYLDLERKGFKVYVVCSTVEDEHYIRSQSRSDLLPLPLDMVDTFTAQEQLARFRQYLARGHSAFEGSDIHHLDLKGLILIPGTQFSPAHIEDISSEEWSDALNAKVLNTIALAQLLLPTVIEKKAHVLMLTPSITSSLRPPMHAIESTVHSALAGFAASLAAELGQDGIPFSHLKLGNIDIPSARHRRDGAMASKFRPTPVRALHHAVFDALVSNHPRRTLFVGRGSMAYGIIGAFAPPSLIAWMLGIGRQPRKLKESRDENLEISSASLAWEKVEPEA